MIYRESTMLLQRFSVFIFLFSLLLSNEHSHAQYKGNSDFLYGKWKSTVPYYISFQAGASSSYTFANEDFINNGTAFSYGLAFEKPLGYRPSLNINFRTRGRYEQSELNNNIDLNSSLITKSVIQKSHDLSLNFSYLIFELKGWEYRVSSGLGYVQNELLLTDSVQRSQNVSSIILPLQISTSRNIYKRFDIEFAYRYYFTDKNIFDGYILNNTYDKYSYAYVALKYMFGEKDYRFMKKGSCPTAK